MKRRPPPDRALLLRAVKWARVPGHTVAGACEKFGLSAAAYARARRELGDAARLTSDEIILSALKPSGPVPVAALINYYDWINHALLTPDEMLAILERLIAAGLVRRVGDGFELAREWP